MNTLVLIVRVLMDSDRRIRIRCPGRKFTLKIQPLKGDDRRPVEERCVIPEGQVHSLLHRLCPEGCLRGDLLSLPVQKGAARRFVNQHTGHTILCLRNQAVTGNMVHRDSPICCHSDMHAGLCVICFRIDRDQVHGLRLVIDVRVGGDFFGFILRISGLFILRSIRRVFAGWILL